MSVDPAEYESPAQRRARIFVRQRRRRRFVAVAALLVLAGVGSAGWAGYRLLRRAPETAGVPLIRADDQPTRKRPSDPGGMAVPDQDSLVLNHSEPKLERLLPPPETPLPRPTPEAPADAAPPPADAEAPSSPPPPPATAATAPPPAASPVSEAKPRPAAPKMAALPPSGAAAPAARGGYRLQLGAVRTPEAAKVEWERLRQQNHDLLGSLGFAAARADLGGRGVFYRIQAGPLADAAAAQRACDALKRRGVGCLLVKP